MFITDFPGADLNLTPDQMQVILSHLSADMGRHDWIRVGMALHHECEGDDTGFDLWDEWSADGLTYPGTEGLRAQWESFRCQVPGKKPVTMASVIKMAKERGYQHAAVRLHEVDLAPMHVTPPPIPSKWQQPVLKPFRGFMADVVELALATSNKRQPAMTQLAFALRTAYLRRRGIS